MQAQGGARFHDQCKYLELTSPCAAGSIMRVGYPLAIASTSASVFSASRGLFQIARPHRACTYCHNRSTYTKPNSTSKRTSNHADMGDKDGDRGAYAAYVYKRRAAPTLAKVKSRAGPSG